jgi:hypothetical protein
MSSSALLSTLQLAHVHFTFYQFHHFMSRTTGSQCAALIAKFIIEEDFQGLKTTPSGEFGEDPHLQQPFLAKAC